MEHQRIQILDRIHTLETGEILGPEEVAAISHLKEQYNETVQNIYQNTPGLFWDIIEVFPEEIWIQIFRQALPSSNYSAALLTLTMVSSTWLQALTSTPLLWAHLEIRGSDEDSLATMGIFTHLSRGVPLTVTIYLPLSHDEKFLHSTLSRVGDRIHHMALRYDSRVFRPPPFTLPKIYYAGIDFLFDTLKYTPNVSVIDLGDTNVRHNDSVLNKLTGSLPPLLRAIRSFCFCSEESLDPLLPLTVMSTCMELDKLISHLGMTTQLQSLSLTRRSRSARTSGTETDPVGLPKEFPKLSNLTNLSISGTFDPNWLDLLAAVAPNLACIKLHIPFSQFTNIFNILLLCLRLRTLLICLHDWEKHGSDAIPNFPPGSSILCIKSLRSLTLRDSTTLAIKEAGARQKHLERLVMAITSITALAREAEEVYFPLPRAATRELIDHILGCISEIPNLKRLSLKGWEWPFPLNQPYRAVLRRLEELNSALPIPFSAPRLLTAQWRPGADEPVSMPEYDNVRTLHVDDFDRLLPWIRFPHDSLPHLINLKLRISGSQHLRLGSFLALTSISLTSGPAGATSLCIALLYQQEDCPCLSEIEFLRSAPEWDMLFIMLERRNFLINRSVSKIRRVSLPFIPNGLRAPLACLLRGLYTTRPPNKDLSFEGIIDLVFDKQITGCTTCLRNVLGPCNEPVVDFDGDVWELDALILSVYSTVDNPPPLHLDSAIVEWIHRREMYTLIWKSAVEDKGPQCWRKATCPRHAHARVEITEHDVD